MGVLAKLIFLPPFGPVKGGLCSLLGPLWKKGPLDLCRLHSGGLSPTSRLWQWCRDVKEIWG